MPFKAYREESRKNWGVDKEGSLDIQQIQTGAMLRIADASEAMAREHNRLIANEKFERERATRLAAEVRHLERRIAALKGVITKMKKETCNG